MYVSRLKLRQSQAIFYDLPKILIILDRFIFLGQPQYTTQNTRNIKAPFVTNPSLKTELHCTGGGGGLGRRKTLIRLHGGTGKFVSLLSDK